MAKYDKKIRELIDGLELTYTQAAIDHFGQYALAAADAEILAARQEQYAAEADATAVHYRDVYGGGGQAPDMVARFEAYAAGYRKAAARWRRVAAAARARS